MCIRDRKTNRYPSSHVQSPVFWSLQTFVKSSPGFRTVPSGMVMSATKILLLQASPSEAVAGAGEVGSAGACVAPATGVLTNDKVGRAAGFTVADGPELPTVGNAKVG